MYIRLKYGAYAGEIRDIQGEAARGLLNSGRAEDPYALVAEILALPLKPERKKKTAGPSTSSAVADFGRDDKGSGDRDDMAGVL